MAISDDILKALDSDQIASIAQQFGLQPDQVKSVIQDAAPAVLGGMARNVESEDGANSLANALGDHADAQPLGDLGSLLGGGAGASILEKVLGGSATSQVSDAIGAQAGVSPASAQGILKIIAPLVMAFLAKQVVSGGKADPAVVKEQVKADAQQAQQSSSPDFGSILGQILGGR